jgi:hypothetical protein
MPAADEYICTGCAVVAKHVNGAKALVVFTFDVPARGEAAATLSVK